MSTIPPDTLIQVLDNQGATHAAQLGPGMLCATVARDLACSPVSWDYGTDRVDCPSCINRMALLGVTA